MGIRGGLTATISGVESSASQIEWVGHESNRGRVGSA
jgi:hypothetical protein